MPFQRLQGFDPHTKPWWGYHQSSYELSASRVFFPVVAGRFARPSSHDLQNVRTTHIFELQSLEQQPDRRPVTSHPALMTFLAFANLSVKPISFAGYLVHLEHPDLSPNKACSLCKSP